MILSVTFGARGKGTEKTRKNYTFPSIYFGLSLGKGQENVRNRPSFPDIFLGKIRYDAQCTLHYGDNLRGSDKCTESL